MTRKSTHHTEKMISGNVMKEVISSIGPQNSLKISADCQAVFSSSSFYRYLLCILFIVIFAAFILIFDASRSTFLAFFLEKWPVMKVIFPSFVSMPLPLNFLANLSLLFTFPNLQILSSILTSREILSKWLKTVDNMSSWLKKSDPKEAMRSNERTLRRTSREIEGDRRQLERKEKELELEIKKLAKQGQKEACGVLAKQLLQLRKQKAKSVNMGARMNAISAKNREIYSVGRMVNAVDKTTDTMKTMSKQLPPEKLARNLQEFVKVQERLGITDEIVSDTLDTMLEESGDEEEQDAIVSKVLDEIGIDLSVQLSKVPEVPSSTAHSADKLSDADLEKMLSELKP